MFDKADKHPSYGTVRFSRVSTSGKTRLFGSSMSKHMSTILLTVREAERSHDLSRDWIHGHKEIVEVELSAAQFAELLTTMNVGSGVPCTIRYRSDIGEIERPPDEEIEIDRVQTSFKDGLSDLRNWIKKQQEDLGELLDKRALNKEDKKKIKWILDKTMQEVESNWPFVVDQFNEATEKVVTAAKSEVDAFVTHVVQKTGLKQLEAMKEEQPVEIKKIEGVVNVKEPSTKD